ncbi:voltage-dependent anion channel [Lactarius akahatsu]|uniref:Voltage-dependent anion channel n=1 Tax=Lactarius akahatsu TaxID=416441 RepID=A0AAD4Q8X2_9AGAM|nr:voltage-dependent anion channel [Lactarius akahatsu]
MPTNSNKKRVADCIRHFTPSWFAVNMGTGAVSLLFSVFPYWTGSDALRALSTAFFFLNLLLFVLFCSASAVRYWCFPGVWRAMLRHPVQGLYVGAFPMGALTLIAVGTTVLHGQYGFGGRAFLYALWGLWWADVALSALCCWGVVYLMIAEQRHALRDMSALWLLPVVTPVVASSGGGALAHALAAHTTTGALATLASAACTLSAGLALALALLVAYLLRLLQHGFPTGAGGVLAACVPLGPMGQAGVAALLLGDAARTLLPRAHAPFFARNERAAEALYALAVCAALALWALATLWLGYALLGIQYALRRAGAPPFTLAYWGLIFPNGVYANLTIALALALDAPFFRIWGAIYAVVTLLLWIVVFSQTVVRVHNGRIFDAPCLQEAADPASSETMQDRAVPVDDQEKTRASIC